MSKEVWESIQAKVYGQFAASLHLPRTCIWCDRELTPVDVGVDPDLNERLWVTNCCGITEKYIEIISEQDFLK